MTGIVLSASSLKPNQGVLSRAYKAVKSHFGITRGDIASLLMMTPPEGVPLVMLATRIITAFTVRFSRHPLSKFVTDVSNDIAIGTARGATSETISNDAMSEWPTLRKWASEKDKFIMRLYAVLLLSTEYDGYTMEVENYSTIDTGRACDYFMRNVRSDVQKALRVFAKQDAVQPQKLLRKCRCAALLAAFLIKMSDSSGNGSRLRADLNLTRGQAWQDFDQNESKRTSPERRGFDANGGGGGGSRSHHSHDDQRGLSSSGAEGEQGTTSGDQEDFEETEDEREFTDGGDGFSTADDSERERLYARRRRRIERETKRDRPASRQDLDDLWAEVERLRALVRNKGAAGEDELKLAAIALPEENSDSEGEEIGERRGKSGDGGRGRRQGLEGREEEEEEEHEDEIEEKEAPSFGIEEEEHQIGVSGWLLISLSASQSNQCSTRCNAT